jgi:hypothetical protein
LSSHSSSVCSATAFFSVRASRGKLLHLVGGHRPCGVAGEATLVGFEKLLRPSIIQALRDALASAQRGDGVVAAQPLQHDADLVVVE